MSNQEMDLPDGAEGVENIEITSGINLLEVDAEGRDGLGQMVYIVRRIINEGATAEEVMREMGFDCGKEQKG